VVYLEDVQGGAKEQRGSCKKTRVGKKNIQKEKKEGNVWGCAEAKVGLSQSYRLSERGGQPEPGEGKRGGDTD